MSNYGQDQYGNQGNQQDQYGNQGNQDQYGNQGNQGSQQDQYGNQDQSGNQQDQYGNQGNQGGQDQSSNQGNQGNQQGNQGAFGGAKQAAENQIDQAIDQFGNKIPGGSQYTQQAKDAAGGILDNLEQEGEKRAGGLGGLFGGNQNQ